MFKRIEKEIRFYVRKSKTGKSHTYKRIRSYALFQCDECKEKMNSCCSNECMQVVELSYEEQKSLRKGKHNSNKIFKKGRSAKLKFKIN